MVRLNMTNTIRLVLLKKIKIQSFIYIILWGGEYDNEDNDNKLVIVDTHTTTVDMTHSTTDASTQPYRSNK